MLPSQQTLHCGLPQSASDVHWAQFAGPAEHRPAEHPPVVHTFVPSGQFAHTGGVH
jgi:hypothetical protein